MFATVDRLADTIIPVASSQQWLAFFTDKIFNIRQAINASITATGNAMLRSLQSLSIYFPNPFNPIQGRSAAGVYTCCHWARGKIHPGQVASPSQGHKERNIMHTHTHSQGQFTNQPNMHAKYASAIKKEVSGENMQTHVMRRSWGQLPLTRRIFWGVQD